MDIATLKKQLDSIESYISKQETVNLKISKVPIGWHLDHSLKVMNKVIETMKNSDPKLYTDNFKLLGKVLITLNYFPVGKAKAPKHVKPPAIVLKEDIVQQLAAARENIKQLPELPSNAFFTHPLFGNVNKSRVSKFLKTHTKHHLKIIKSILDN